LKRKKESKTLIGRRERVNFPDLGLFNIDAKVDTGAYTSAIHCSDVAKTSIDGKPYVKFQLLDPTHPDYDHRPFELPVYKEKRIKSSIGVIQKRIIIRTKMEIAGRAFLTELSLADRSKMEYPVLLGRKALKGKFIVDVSLLNVSSQTN